MAWSDIVRKDAGGGGGGAPLPPSPSPSPTTTPPSSLLAAPAVEPALPLPPRSLSSRDGISVAVVDANALITSAFKLAGLSDRFVTIKEALAEVRDPASRTQLAALPFTVECLEPSEEALSKVVQFTRETGDLPSLSEVDLKLISLAYTLEVQAHGSAHLRTRPPPLQVIQAKQIYEHNLPGWGSNVPNLEEWEEFSQESDDYTHQDSHILGLKNLSFTSNCFSRVAEEKSCAVDCESTQNVGNIAWTYDKKPEIFTCTEASTVEVDNQNGMDISLTCNQSTSISGLCDYTKDSLQDLSSRQSCSITPDTINVSVISQEVDSKESINTVMVDHSQDKGEWTRAISRSTRRKHEKRAARTALKNSVVEGPYAERIENQKPADFGMDGLKLTDEEDPDLDKGVFDENTSDGELEEENNPNESSEMMREGTSEGVANSHYASESEDSWMLRPLSSSTVACITTDFPMQNVLLQIGLRVMSLNGLQVQQLHRWVLKCEACRKVTFDVGRIFCPKCGNGGTLHKVSVTVGPNGVVHTGTRRRVNIRGTKYSLPMPKGGRKGVTDNPILREDQLPPKVLHPRKNKVVSEDIFLRSEIFAHKGGKKGQLQPPVQEALAVFSGKRNPNDCRFKQRR